MCKCNSNIRTPFCGMGDCINPHKNGFEHNAEIEQEENCLNCKFFVEISTLQIKSLKLNSKLSKEWFDGINGACQRYPPTINIQVESDHVRNTFPLVKHKTWCGEWLSKISKKKYIKTPYGPMEVIE